MTNVPEAGLSVPVDPEDLRIALLDSAPDDLTGAAVTLLVDIPGRVYTDPAFRRYLRVADPPAGALPGASRDLADQLVTVDWATLGADMHAGAMLHLPHATWALLLVAASIGGGDAVPVRLGGALQRLTPTQAKPLISALQHAVGEW
jgi:hypothetical protein